MKKLLLLTLMLGACQQFDTLKETIPNPKCEGYEAFEVYQVGSNYLLAKACDNTLFGKCNYTTTVRLPKEEGKTYYDTQRIEIPADKCATLNGIYEYKTALGEKKTVPVVEFDDFRLPNPNFEN